ncbi:MAG: bifunctional hydroxymethylpyrimidine kinase/phosphomethylpyrimidine kinase [Planctomycetes bacterium]|nr:bifunctional hydroxymethylpyrimidine kinase/phosphomethylpyrimidine kinase [Planctomycetota bacterium]
MIALTIAGSDPSGGAGIQADLKTFSALGVYGAAAITSLTAQNTREVRAIQTPPCEFVAHELDCVFEDLEVAATKIGMLSSSTLIRTVAERLRAHGARHIVLDPVMVAKSGAKLLADESVAALRSELFPLASVLTPNLPEAAVLLDTDEASVLRAPERACEQLVALGARAVVLKGGHAHGATSDDLWFDGAHCVRLSAVRTPSRNTHGTGCTFSAAIAALLARGESPLAAVEGAKRYVSAAIAGSADWQLGHGHGPVHHFHALWSAGVRP